MSTSIYKVFVCVLIFGATIIGCSSVNTTPSVGDNSVVFEKANLDGLGKTQISPSDKMTMVYVPAGEFLMGSKIGLTDEQPVHKVYLDAYWVDRTEITNSMYSECVKSGACDKPSALVFYNDSAYTDHPVEYVSWTDAVNYCAWVGRRLPPKRSGKKSPLGIHITISSASIPGAILMIVTKGILMTKPKWMHP